jgi:hypothetical protein
VEAFKAAWAKLQALDTVHVTDATWALSWACGHALLHDDAIGLD